MPRYPIIPGTLEVSRTSAPRTPRWEEAREVLADANKSMRSTVHASIGFGGACLVSGAVLFFAFGHGAGVTLIILGGVCIGLASFVHVLFGDSRSKRPTTPHAGE